MVKLLILNTYSTDHLGRAADNRKALTPAYLSLTILNENNQWLQASFVVGLVWLANTGTGRSGVM